MTFFNCGIWVKISNSFGFLARLAAWRILISNGRFFGEPTTVPEIWSEIGVSEGNLDNIRFR
jgi:hypothetical protein